VVQQVLGDLTVKQGDDIDLSNFDFSAPTAPSINWVERGKVNPARDQGDCARWAHPAPGLRLRLGFEPAPGLHCGYRAAWLPATEEFTAASSVAARSAAFGLPLA